MKLIIPTALVLAALGVFFGYVDPKYDNIQTLKETEDRFNEALDRSRDLIAVRDELLAKYNTFPEADVERLTKLLPDNVDNVRLTLDIDNIAARYGMSLRNVTIASEVAEEEGGRGRAQSAQRSDKPYSSIILDFTVTASYENFVQFIADLENSLRLVDIVALAFEAGDADLNQYDVSIRTYWLK